MQSFRVVGERFHFLMFDGRENIRLWARDSGYDSTALDRLRKAGTMPIVIVPIAVLTEGRSPRVLVQNGLELAHPAEIVFTEAGFPLSPTDPFVRQIQDKRARVVIVDINLENFQNALHAVEIIRRIAGHLAVVVRGDLRTPMNLMAAMRLGADEYLGRENRYDVLDTFWCLSSARRKTNVPDRETPPPTALVYAPIGRGPRPMRPREVALAI